MKLTHRAPQRHANGAGSDGRRQAFAPRFARLSGTSVLLSHSPTAPRKLQRREESVTRRSARFRPSRSRSQGSGSNGVDAVLVSAEVVIKAAAFFLTRHFPHDMDVTRKSDPTRILACRCWCRRDYAGKPALLAVDLFRRPESLQVTSKRR